MKLRVASIAEREFAEGVEYYSAASTGAAISFIEEVENAFDEIATNPLLYALRTKISRVKPLRVFPYNIIYRVAGEHVEILSIHHQSRMPDRWRDRE